MVKVPGSAFPASATLGWRQGMVRTNQNPNILGFFSHPWECLSLAAGVWDMGNHFPPPFEEKIGICCHKTPRGARSAGLQQLTKINKIPLTLHILGFSCSTGLSQHFPSLAGAESSLSLVVLVTARAGFHPEHPCFGIYWGHWEN